MKRICYLPLLFTLTILLFGCRTHTDPLVYATYSTRAISPEGSGNYVLRVQGKGTNSDMAIKNAVRKAVHDVIFDDVHLAYGDHKPLMRLITDPSTEQKNSDFFNNFFANKGEYLKFAKATKDDKETYSEGHNYTVIVNVVVKHSELRDYLFNNGLIK